jgi:hypothetical protein
MHCPPSRWPGRVVAGTEQPPLSGRGLRGPPAATGSRAAAPAPSLAAGRPGGRPGAGTPARLPLDLVDLAFAVVLAASPEREQLRVPR